MGPYSSRTGVGDEGGGDTVGEEEQKPVKAEDVAEKAEGVTSLGRSRLPHGRDSRYQVTADSKIRYM